MTREELLGLRGVGTSALGACERLIGNTLPRRRSTDPVEVFWRGRGIPARAARALSQAGLSTPEDLQELWREDLLELPGIGKTVLRRLEALSGREMPSRIAYWLDQGLSLFVAHALVRARIYTCEALAPLTREQFLARPGLGLFVLGQCEKLLHRRLPL